MCWCCEPILRGYNRPTVLANITQEFRYAQAFIPASYICVEAVISPEYRPVERGILPGYTRQSGYTLRLWVTRIFSTVIYGEAVIPHSYRPMRAILDRNTYARTSIPQRYRCLESIAIPDEHNHGNPELYLTAIEKSWHNY